MRYQKQHARCVRCGYVGPLRAFEVEVALSADDSGDNDWVINFSCPACESAERPDVYNDPKFLNNEVYPKVFQELDRDSNQLPENYQGQIAANYRLPDVDAILKKAMTAVAKNEAEPTASFLKQLNDDIQKVLDQPRA